MNRLAPRVLHELMIANEITHAKRGHARLACAEEVAGTAKLQVALGDLETVGRLGERLQASPTLLRQRILIQQDAVRLMRAPADAASQLMKLRQPEAFGVLHEHDRGVCDVDANFDHRGRDQHVELAARERPHDPVLRIRLHSSVQQRDAIRGEDIVREVIRHLRCRLEIHLLRLFDQRVDDIHLPSRVDLLANEVVDFVAA